MLPIKIDSREFELLYYNITSKNNFPCCISVVGAQKQSGTTCISYALARRMAASGHRTLIIDLNIDKSDLSDYLSSQKSEWTPSDFLNNAYIEKLGSTGLSLMSAPTSNTILWPFREKKILTDMINILKKSYDCIIIDVPAILKDKEQHDKISSEIICSASDLTIISVLSGKTTENDIVITVNLLKKSNAQIHGIIINDQHSPLLKDEICRELDRLKNIFPNIVKSLKEKVQNSTFLSQEI